MSDQSLDTNIEATDAQDSFSQSQESAARTYTQEEFDRHMAGLKNSLTKKFEKQFSELGDLEELRSLKVEAERRKTEQAIKRGEFEKTLQDLAAKKDAEIQKRDKIIQDYKLNMPLLNAAAKYKAVNPEQVQQLLRNNLRLNEDGDAEILDGTGAVRYTDSGALLTVEQYVEEWLKNNPHFMSAAPATVNTKSMVSPGSNGKLDLRDLDLTRPQDRQLYKEARQKGLF